jgi:hypothetical protein
MRFRGMRLRLRTVMPFRGMRLRLRTVMPFRGMRLRLRTVMLFRGVGRLRAVTRSWLIHGGAADSERSAAGGR